MSKLRLLDRVTITGADDSVNPNDLYELSQTYKFVEWGILLSKDKSGVERYPSQQWRDDLYRLWNQKQDKNFVLSGHICGKWVRDIIEGQWCLNQIQNHEMFARFQLNFSPYICNSFKQPGAIEKFLAGFENPDLYFRQFIFQTNSFTNVHEELMNRTLADEIDAVWLFDISGGRGILPDQWLAPNNNTYIGYAGGLNPDNVGDQLRKIDQVSPLQCWIDVESGVRSVNEPAQSATDKFDLEKVAQFLHITQYWVESFDWLAPAGKE